MSIAELFWQELICFATQPLIPGPIPTPVISVQRSANARSTEAGPDLFASVDEPGFVHSLRNTITAANVLPFASLD